MKKIKVVTRKTFVGANRTEVIAAKQTPRKNKARIAKNKEWRDLLAEHQQSIARRFK
jgi:hypothetical protein